MLLVEDGVELVLASSSPRRKELLESLGLSVKISPSEIDESPRGASPEELVKRLSIEKAGVAARRFADSWILGGDTVVVVDGQILGKPEDAKDASQMLTLLSGKQHAVWGGFSVVNLSKGYQEAFASETKVVFQPLSLELIESYVSSGEPYGKAGGYAIQGVGQAFVAAINGSYTNVVGLDVPKVVQALLELQLVRWS